MKVVFIGGPRVMTREMRSAIYEYVATLDPDEEIIMTGGADGVDETVMEAARKQGFTLVTVKPDYGSYGRAAPLVRNTYMAQRCDRAVFFWDGESRGTHDAINKVRREGKPCDVRLFGTTARAVCSSLEPAPAPRGRTEVSLV